MSRCLYRKAEVREITFRFGRPDNLSMTPSVMPSLRYSTDESPVALANGSTATELIGAWLLLPKWIAAATSATTKRNNATAITHVLSGQRTVRTALAPDLPDSLSRFRRLRSA